jgi:hypothetical protein
MRLLIGLIFLFALFTSCGHTYTQDEVYFSDGKIRTCKDNKVFTGNLKIVYRENESHVGLFTVKDGFVFESEEYFSGNPISHIYCIPLPNPYPEYFYQITLDSIMEADIPPPLLSVGFNLRTKRNQRTNNIVDSLMKKYRADFSKEGRILYDSTIQTGAYIPGIPIVCVQSRVVAEKETNHYLSPLLATAILISYFLLARNYIKTANRSTNPKSDPKVKRALRIFQFGLLFVIALAILISALFS